MLISRRERQPLHRCGLSNEWRETGVLIYTVAMGAGYDPEAAYGLGLMKQIAEMTGAHNF